MRLGLGETIRKAGSLASRQERIDFLRRHDSEALRIVLRVVYDETLPDIDLPKGWRPEYRPCEFLDQESVLFIETRKFNKFFVDGYPGLTQDKKKNLFVALLESVPPDDATLLMGVKDKRMPFPGITKNLVEAAFPDLIQKESAGEPATE